MFVTSVEYLHFHYPAQRQQEIHGFYTRVLKAQAVAMALPSHLLKYRLGNQVIQLTPWLATPGKATPQHVAFNVEGIAQLKLHLQALDVPFGENHPDDPIQRVRIKDPAGNQLEFVQASIHTSMEAVA